MDAVDEIRSSGQVFMGWGPGGAADVCAERRNPTNAGAANLFFFSAVMWPRNLGF